MPIITDSHIAATNAGTSVAINVIATLIFFVKTDQTTGKWWYSQGKQDYPNADSILLLCDGGGGGSNGCNQYIFKQDLQSLVDEIGVEIRVSHYPAYCSKYNPIEHRLFPHVTRACQGVVFASIDLVMKLIKRTKTEKGLRVEVNLIKTVNKTGRKVCASFKKNMPIIFDAVLPKWNYRAAPQNI